MEVAKPASPLAETTQHFLRAICKDLLHISQHTKEQGRLQLAVSGSVETDAKRHLFEATIHIENGMLSSIDQPLSSQTPTV